MSPRTCCIINPNIYQSHLSILGLPRKPLKHPLGKSIRDYGRKRVKAELLCCQTFASLQDCTTLRLRELNHLHLSLANPFMLQAIPTGSLEGTNGPERSERRRRRRIKPRAAGCSHQVEDGKTTTPPCNENHEREQKRLTVSDPES